MFMVEDMLERIRVLVICYKYRLLIVDFRFYDSVPLVIQTHKTIKFLDEIIVFISSTYFIANKRFLIQT